MGSIYKVGIWGALGGFWLIVCEFPTRLCVNSASLSLGSSAITLLYATSVLNCLDDWSAVEARNVVLTAAGGDDHLVGTEQYWPKAVGLHTDNLAASAWATSRRFISGFHYSLRPDCDHAESAPRCRANLISRGYVCCWPMVRMSRYIGVFFESAPGSLAGIVNRPPHAAAVGPS